MKKETVIAVVLAVLVLFSLVQAFEISSVKAKIASGELSVAGATSGIGASGGSGPKSLQNLPQMVGGC